MSQDLLSSSMFAQYHQQLEEIIKKRKRIEFELQDGPSEFVTNFVKNLKLEEFEPSQGIGRVYSNDMTDACRTKCRICNWEVTLNYMRNHTKNAHSMTIHEYKDLHGKHREQIVAEIWHKCGLCEEDMLLDADDIRSHTRKHQTSLKDYNAKFIIGSKTSPRRKIKKEIKKEMIQETCEEGFNTIMDIENLFDTL